MPAGDSFQLHMQKLPVKDSSVLETLYGLGNGHMGIRASNPLQGSQPNQDGQPGMFVNGFFDLSEITYGENYPGFPQNAQAIAELPDPRYLIFEIDGERSDEVAFDVKSVDKNLDMKTGRLLEIFEVTSPSNKTIRLTMQSFVSHDQTNLFVVTYSVSATNFDGAVTIIKQHRYTNRQIDNSNDVRADQQTGQLERTFIDNQTTAMLLTTRKSQLSLLIAFQPLDGLDQLKFSIMDELPSYGRTFDLTPGLNVQFGFVYSVGDPHPLMDMSLNRDRYAKEALDRTTSQTFRALYDASCRQLDAFWETSDVEVGGDATLARGIRFNLFNLYQSAGRDGLTSIPAKGLTGAGYGGHYFWDAEMFMLPFFTYTQPEIAKQLLTFRAATLPQAQQRARELNVQNGVLFPWRTINGEESSAYYPAGTAQVHINADIAYAVDTYVRVTADEDFLVKTGFNIILETARFWLSYGHFAQSGPHRGHFVIDDVTGPDEYTTMVNNNYYTNRMAKNNLMMAAKYAKLLKQQHQDLLERLGVDNAEINDFEYAADQMVLPFDRDRRVKMQDDSSMAKPFWPIDKTANNQFPLLLHFHPMILYHYQVNKQADTVMSDFLFPADQSTDQLKRDFNYYEAITVHDSSLSRAIFGVLAHRLHLAGKAYGYFMDTALMDLTNSQGNTDAGVHAANMGGTWLSLIYGFGGLEQERGTLNFDPKLPDQWTNLTFKLKFKHRLLAVRVTQTSLTLTLLSGTDLSVFFRHQPQRLTINQPLVISLIETT